MRKCSYCGTEYGDDVLICERDQNPLTPTPEPDAQAGNPLKVILIIVGVIGVVVGGRFIYEYQVIRPRMLESQAISCGANLKAIEGAKAVWMLENRKTDRDEPPPSALFGPGTTMESLPQCHGGGTYRIGTCGEPPSCSVHSR